MENNNQQPPQENPNNQFSNNEPMTFAQKVEYVKSTEMTNNKQQTEINAVEYLDKVNQFAKENNTDKPKQQTAIEWLLNAIQTKNGEEFSSYYTEFIEQAKEMDKEQKRKDCNYWEQMGVLKALKVPNRKTFEQYYTETYKQ